MKKINLWSMVFYASMTIFIFAIILMVGFKTFKIVPDAILIPALMITAIGIMMGGLGMERSKKT